MRLVTPGDSTPASVNRYLLPHETQVITVRRHPAILLMPVGMVLGGLIIAGLLSNTIANEAGAAANLIWWLWLILLAWFVWKVAEWSVDYFVITNQRMLLTTGLITRKVAMMPLAKVTDMSFERPIQGRMLGYGKFVLESAGQDQALRTVDYLPYPEQLYLETCEMIFPAKVRSEEEKIREEIHKLLQELGTIDRLLGRQTDGIHSAIAHLEAIDMLLEHQTDPDQLAYLNQEKRDLLDELQALHDQLHDRLPRETVPGEHTERTILNEEKRVLLDRLQAQHDRLAQIMAEKEGKRRPQVP
jgi:membrane protein YdbS with pleckstrin-like domain